VVDVPFGEALIREFRDEMGITVENYSIVNVSDENAAATSGPRPRARVFVGPMSAGVDQPQGILTWVAFLDYTDWASGQMQMQGLTVSFRVGWPPCTGTCPGRPSNVWGTSTSGRSCCSC